MIDQEITNEIIGCAIDIHRQFGPGLLESAYREFLCHDLLQKGYIVEKEKSLPVIYKEVRMQIGYRMDIVVENKIVIELKHVEKINEIHVAQLLTYMKLGGFRVGLLINFQTSLLKNGIKRLVL